jgi:hypothetical protein
MSTFVRSALFISALATTTPTNAALKDIMTAIRAAAIIVHDYGVDDYALESE